MGTMLPVAEAAARLGMTRQGLGQAVQRGAVKGEYRRNDLGRNSLWIALSEVERFANVRPKRGRPRLAERARRDEEARRLDVEKGLRVADAKKAANTATGIRLTQSTLMRDVLDELCQTRVTYSTVTLAIDMVERGRMNELGDPVGLLSEVIEELGSAGLVKYSVRHTWASIPLKIRVTPKGYAVAGYTEPHAQVGSRSTNRMPLRPGEAMEWRLLDSMTWGGPIERTSLAEHLDLYPEHRSIHPSVWECGPYAVANGDDDMAETHAGDHARMVAQAVQWLDEEGLDAIQARVKERLSLSDETANRWFREAIQYGYIEPVGTIRKVGQQFAVTTLGLKAISTAEPVVESTRQVVLNELRLRGKVASSKDLLRYIGQIDERWRKIGLHSLQHQLRVMQKAGLIRFADKVMGNVREIRNIELAHDVEWYGATFAKNEGPKMTQPNAVLDADSAYLVGVADGWESALPVEPESTSASEPAPDRLGQAWPALEALRTRERESERRQGRAAAYMAAAEALAGIDEEESERLFKTAGLVAEENRMSEVESEYLRYAKEHE